MGKLLIGPKLFSAGVFLMGILLGYMFNQGAALCWWLGFLWVFVCQRHLQNPIHSPFQNSKSILHWIKKRQTALDQLTTHQWSKVLSQLIFPSFCVWFIAYWLETPLPWWFVFFGALLAKGSLKKVYGR
jgi:hypothetical protein